MGDRFYCPIHHKTMTASSFRRGHPVMRCEDCVSEAREKVHACMADFNERTKGKGGRFSNYNYK